MKKRAFLYWTSLLFIALLAGWIQAEENPAREREHPEKRYETATFATGCFWCTQHDFDQVKGVVSTLSGYTGGNVPNPSYEEVSTGGTGHVEAVQLQYDPKVISYEELLNFYWYNVDPTRNDGQFCDKGRQYRPLIFYHNEKQKELAEASKERLIRENKIHPILVDILPAKTFYPAEEHHQSYYKKHSFLYRFYRYRCGRDARLEELWGKNPYSQS